MASTNKTSNLGLPQWERTDSFEAADMNSAFNRLDTAVKEAKDISLKLYKLFESDVASSSQSVVSFDLSEIDLGSYIALIFAFPETTDCTARFKSKSDRFSNTLETMKNSSMILCFPLGIDCPTAHITVTESARWSNNMVYKYGDIASLVCTAVSGQTFSKGIKMRLWGVK